MAGCLSEDAAEDKENRMDVSLQFCEDEDEVFFGSVTSKENRKASKYSERRTALFDTNFRRDRRLMRYTMDRLSMMNMNHPEVVLGSEGSELCESPLGSAASIDSPLGSDVGAASGDESPLVNGWLKAAGLDTLMEQYDKSLGLIGNISDAEFDRICGDNVVCAQQSSSTHVNGVLVREQSNSHVHRDQSQQVSDVVDQSGIHAQNCDQSNFMPGKTVMSNSISQITDNLSATGANHSQCTIYPLDNSNPISHLDQSDTDKLVDSPSAHSHKEQSRSCVSSQSNLVSQSEQGSVSQSDLATVSQSETATVSQSELGTLSQLELNSFSQSESPLLISAAHDLSSPQLLLDDLSAIHTATLADIFDQQCSTSADHNSHDQSHDQSRNQSHDQSHDQSNEQHSPVPEVNLVIQSVSDSVSKEQEVPTMVTSSEQNSDHRFGLSQNDTMVTDEVPAIRFGLGATNDDADISIVTLGTMMEESIMDMSHRIYSYDNGASDSDMEDSAHCHLVPEMAVTPNYYESGDSRSKSLSRSGVTFTEDFSPTLTVITSPGHSDEETSPITMATCWENRPHTLPLSPRGEVHSRLHQDSVSPTCMYDQHPPDSPLSPADVKFTFLKESPRKSRVKRLSPLKISHSEPRPMGAVFDRLNSLEDIADTAEHEQHLPAKKGTLRRAQSASKVMHQPRLNTASQLRMAARSQDHSPRKALYFGGSARETGRAGHIRTTGSVNRQAISQVTSAQLTPRGSKVMPIAAKSTTPRSNTTRFNTSRSNTPRSSLHHATPGSDSVPRDAATGNKHKPSATTPSVSNHGSRPTTGPRSTPSTKSAPQKPPPHRPTLISHRPTPNTKALKSPGQRVYKCGTPRYVLDNKPLYIDSVPPLDLDNSELDGSLMLDDSIVIQEKRVELERLRAEKMRLQKKISRQRSEGQSPRSPLMPTTADNLPRVRVKDKQALSLSEPELDAITLVHTLCNSQQVVKIVSKQRAATVVRHNYPHKEASKIQWHEDLVTMVTDGSTVYSPKPSKPRRKSILNMRAPDKVYPYNEQPASPVVVTKSSRKSLSYGKEPSPLIGNKGFY